VHTSAQHVAASQFWWGMHMVEVLSSVRGATLHATPAAWHVVGHGGQSGPPQSTPACAKMAFESAVVIAVHGAYERILNASC
jgi:hypothetical protein